MSGIVAILHHQTDVLCAFEGDVLQVSPDQILIPPRNIHGLHAYRSISESGVLVLDDFSGVDGAALTGRSPSPINRPAMTWLAQGVTAGQDTTFQIQSNKAQTSGPVYPATCTLNAGVANGVIACTVKALYYSAQAGLAFRLADRGSFFCAYVFDNFFRLSRYENGVTVADLATAYPVSPYGVEHVLEVTLAGASIRVAVNGVQLADVNDTHNQMATRHGLWAATTPTEYDDFEISQ